MKVVVTDYAWPSLDVERSVLAGLGADLVVAHDGEALAPVVADASAILTNWRVIPPEALENAPECLIVSRYGVGVDNIPVDLATELGILVTNVPTFCVEEVADHTMALLLACARRIIPFTELTRSGLWNLAGAPGIARLRGQTLGLVGFGKTARAVASRATAFGLEVLVYSRRENPDPVEGVSTTSDLGLVLAESDFVALHLPATKETHNLIGERELRMMKPTAYLINTARGALIEEDALFSALTRGWIAGAALDVLAREPPSAPHPLLGLPNVIATPHAAFYSEEALSDVARAAARNVVEALVGTVPAALVNPEVLGSKALRVRVSPERS
jgi:D-3-phosphoglycerate dehydrogenase